jgi:hypothetical protein
MVNSAAFLRKVLNDHYGVGDTFGIDDVMPKVSDSISRATVKSYLSNMTRGQIPLLEVCGSVRQSTGKSAFLYKKLMHPFPLNLRSSARPVQKILPRPAPQREPYSTAAALRLQSALSKLPRKRINQTPHPFDVNNTCISQ